MEEFTKKVVPGKINHKNAINSFQIVLSTLKSGIDVGQGITVGPGKFV